MQICANKKLVHAPDNLAISLLSSLEPKKVTCWFTREVLLCHRLCTFGFHDMQSTVTCPMNSCSL